MSVKMTKTTSHGEWTVIIYNQATSLSEDIVVLSNYRYNKRVGILIEFKPIAFSVIESREKNLSI